MSESPDVAEIPRDRWGRPLIPHPTTGVVHPYTRASTLSKAIDNGGGLADWRVGKVVEGLRMDPSLLKLDTTPKVIAELALDAAGANRAAEAGTRLHALTETLDRGGMWPGDADNDDTGNRLRAYLDATQVLRMIGVELFVANLLLMSAGTFDRVVSYKGVLYIADIKTGKDAAKYSHAAAVQMAVYAGGRRWDPVKGWGVSMFRHVDQDKAILIHLPAVGEPSCSLHWVDIRQGLEMALVAARVRDWRSVPPAQPMEVG